MFGRSVGLLALVWQILNTQTHISQSTICSVCDDGRMQKSVPLRQIGNKIIIKSNTFGLAWLDSFAILLALFFHTHFHFFSLVSHRRQAKLKSDLKEKIEKSDADHVLNTFKPGPKLLSALSIQYVLMGNGNDNSFDRF